MACKELGIENLDLYGGTKHTTVTAANECLTPEQIKQGTGHTTNNYPAASSGVSTKDWAFFIVASDGVLDPMLRNEAFERYFKREVKDAVQVYQTISGLQHTYNQKKGLKVDK